MTVEEALGFFEAIPAVRAKLQTLHDVGLGYIHLAAGHHALGRRGPAGEAVVRAVAARHRTIYILDEPTAGCTSPTPRLLEVSPAWSTRGTRWW